MKIQRENWQRSYRITIGTPDRIVGTEVPTYLYNGTITKDTPTPTVLIDQRTIPSNARVLSNLPEDDQPPRGFSFEFDSSRRLEPAGKGASNSERTTLRLFNLDEDMIYVLNQQGCVVMIELGYGGEVSLAYSGDVIEVIPTRNGSGITYTINCGDGFTSDKNTRLNADYDESMSDRDIIVDMSKRFPGTALGTYGLEDASGRYTVGGKSFAGKLLTSFDKILAKNNLSWGRFNGKMVIVPYRLKLGSGDYDKFAKVNYELDADILHYVKRVSQKGEFLAKEEKSKRYPVTVSTFYIPIELGNFFTVMEDVPTELSGTYLTKSVRISAQSQGQNWYSILQGDPL